MHYITADGEITELNLVFKTPYNHDTLAEALRTAQVNDEPSKTQQHFKDEADINEIMRRWLKTGEIKEIPLPPQYGDFHRNGNRLPLTQQPHCRDQRTLLPPAAVRASYQNDPGLWVEDVNTRLAGGDLEPLKAMGLDVTVKTVDPPDGTGTPTVAEPPKPRKGRPAPLKRDRTSPVTQHTYIK